MGSVMDAASASITAQPPFMSTVPRPHSTSPSGPDSSREGRLPFTGTVSRWPAITARLERPREVRATTASPSRSTSRCGSARSAASTASAMAASSPETDSRSTSRRVSSTAGRARSSTAGEGTVTAYGLPRRYPESMTAAWGHGLATTATSGAGAGTVLDTWFPAPKLGERPGSVDPHIAPADFESWVGNDPRREVSVDYVNVTVDTKAARASTPDAYLRLHL